MTNFNYILNAISFAETNDSLKSIQIVFNSITQTATGITATVFGSLAGFVVLISIIWFIIQLFRYYFASDNQVKTAIWDNIKKSLMIVGWIMAILIAAGGIISGFVYIATNSLSGVQQVINPSSSAPSVGGPSAASPGA